MMGAGIFFDNNNNTVIVKTMIFSRLKPDDFMRINAAIAISPPATAVIPDKAILMPLMVRIFDQTGYTKKIKSIPGRNIPMPAAKPDNIWTTGPKSLPAIPPA